MTIRLFWNTDPANKIGKTISKVDELTGYLRYPSSIIDPVITIERSSPTGFNYVQIPEFNRFYYVNNIVADNNGLITLSMHVDVLQSFASQIRQCQAIIRRQENEYNLLLDDGIFKAYQNSKHKIIAFPNEMNGFSYVLAIAGNSDDNQGS